MRSAMLLGILALYGCASSPGYRSTAVALPAAYRAAAPTVPSSFVAPADSTAPASEYWQRLGDTTLSRLIGEVRRANLDVQAARARVSAARSDRLRSLLDLTPSATVSGGYVRQRLSSA